MSKGVAQVRSDLTGFMFFGFSYQHLYFDPDDGEGEDTVTVLQSRESRGAYYCYECRGLFCMPDIKKKV